MTPIKFTIKNGETHFHYKPSEIIKFVREGKKEGNVGLILTRRRGKLLCYRGFGTYENPIKEIRTNLIYHFETWDGPMPSDKSRLIPPKPFFTEDNTSIVLLDMSKARKGYKK
jgi:hypothetical protein